MTRHIETEVLVVGAGPVGLSLAGDLGWRGHRSIIVERGDGTVQQPKMDQVGIRTMEICRRWGIVGDVEASPYDRDYPQDNIYLTALNGYELGREPFPSMREEQAPPESPQHRERCPQNMFDPVLRRFAETQDGVRLLYRHTLESFAQSRDGVVAYVRNADGEPLEIRASYLVGCDGGRSTVREQLGISMHGRGLLTYTTNVIFRCAGFNELHDKAPGYRYMFVGPNGVWATIVAIDGRDHWRMSIIGDREERREYRHDELQALAFKALGRSFQMEIVSVLPWARYERVAERFSQGRVYLAGDACHLTSPTGGLGMNTGIGDAVDLSWKLAALLEGWGGPALAESYAIERKPIANRITRFSTSNLSLMQSVRSDERLYEDSVAGREVRERVGAALTEGMKREWYSMNMHLGTRYVDSTICVYSEVESREAIDADYAEGKHYRPTSRPGCRAPHAWLPDRRSTLDLFGRGYVLLCLGTDAATARPLLEAASLHGIPLEAIEIDELQVKTLYERRFVLVRPDGHVAWRADTLPSNPAGVVLVAAGHHESLMYEAVQV